MSIGQESKNLWVLVNATYMVRFNRLSFVGERLKHTSLA